MTTHTRPERVAQAIQVAIASILARGEMRDPRIGFVTITGVKVSPDLRVAKVFYSAIGADEALEQTQAGLDAAKGYFRCRQGIFPPGSQRPGPVAGVP